MSCSEEKIQWLCCCGFKENECTWETQAKCPDKKKITFIGYHHKFDELKHITNIESGEKPNLQELAKEIKYVNQVKPRTKSKYHN